MAKKTSEAYQTKKPTGLKTARKGNKITLSWKIADSDYAEGQKIVRNIWTGKTKLVKKKKKLVKSKKHYAGKLGVKTTSFLTTLNPKNYYPYKGKPFLLNINFAVAGKRKKFEDSDHTYDPSWSAWGKHQLLIKKPDAPKVSFTLDSERSNVSLLQWEKKNDNTSFKWFTDYEVQWLTVYNSNVKNGKDVKGWSTAGKYTGTGTSKELVQDSAQFEGYYSQTKWARVRCRGPRGASAWVYRKHVYAVPPKPKNIVATTIGDKHVGKNAARGIWRVNVKWDSTESLAHPIDKTAVSYLVTVPATRVTTKTEDGRSYSHAELIPPAFSGGTDVDAVKDTKGKDGIVFSVPTLSGIDHCVVIRITNYHDRVTNVGDTTYVEGSFGDLATPTINNIGTLDPSTKRINIQATNNSEVENTHLVVCYKTESDPQKIYNIGIIPPGRSDLTVRLPDSCTQEAYSLGVYARLGDYYPLTPSESSFTDYELTNDILTSSCEWSEGVVPQPPKTVDLKPGKTVGTINVSWDWSWLEANGAELSWSSHEDAWESTDEPSTYIVNNTSAASWNITGLDVGTWYVRVRLFKSNDDGAIYGGYSDTKSIDISSSPLTPSLTIEPESGIISETGKVTCFWAYTTTDGTSQMNAAICEATLNNDNTFTYGTPFAWSGTSTNLTVYAEDRGWKSGETHYLAVQVISESGKTSDDWSTPVPITIANNLEIEIKSTTLETVTETIEDGDETVSISYKVLTQMPLGVSFGRVGSNEDLEGTASLVIERAEPYPLDRPDESTIDGFKGETVALVVPEFDDTTYLEQEDLMGVLDDGAKYKLIIVVTDTYGQTAETEPLIFEVRWNHQAVIPSAEVEAFTDGLYATIKPLAPVGYELSQDTGVVSGKSYYTRTGEGTEENPYVYTPVSNPSGNPKTKGYYEAYNSSADACDIYRLSADSPELIYNDAQFGTKYVDPYPTLKEFGGYRVVYLTANGDYITEDNHLAWVDYMESEHQIDLFATIIDFGKRRVILPYDIELSSKWNKDFIETKYLGGAVQGDWNPAVSRTGSVRSNTIVFEDPDTIRSMRLLADYPGICHVRTPDGSNYTANVDVSEDRENKMVGKVAKFSLDITRVDPEELDGELYDQWISENQ